MSDLLNHLGSIWYHSEPLEVPYFSNQFLGLDFFCRFLQQTGSNWPMNRIFVIWNECQWMQSPIMTTLFLCIQNAYVASLSALLVESVCTHLVYGSRQQYQLGCGVSSLGETTFFGFCLWNQFWQFNGFKIANLSIRGSCCIKFISQIKPAFD